MLVRESGEQRCMRTGKPMAKSPRDVERMYDTGDVVAKLRRLADALEQEKPFRIQIAGERIRVPARAEFSLEHERGEDEEEIEFQLKWTLNGHDADDAADDAVV
jgi:amphi-Trp domain-containing protein